MPGIPLSPVYAHSVEDLLDSGQDLNNGSTATSLPAGSNGITARQTQGTRQLQETSSTTVHLSTTTPDADVKGFADDHVDATVPAHDLGVADDSMITTRSLSNNNLPASSTRTSVGTQDEGDGETVHQNAHTQSMPPVSSITLEPSIIIDSLNLQTSSGEIVLANGASKPISSTATVPHLTLISGTQSVTANSKSQFIFPSSQTLSFNSTSTLGSGTPISVLAPSDFGHQHILASDSATSLSPHAIALPDFSKSPPALTINAQTVTAHNLGHYLLDNQTLTRGGMITVSDTKISLAPNASDVFVGTSTEALRPSFTAGFGSGANGTKVQKFSGDALGVRDGLWGSSLMLLVSFFVLLWL